MGALICIKMGSADRNINGNLPSSCVACARSRRLIPALKRLNLGSDCVLISLKADWNRAASKDSAFVSDNLSRESVSVSSPSFIACLGSTKDMASRSCISGEFRSDGLVVTKPKKCELDLRPSEGQVKG